MMLEKENLIEKYNVAGPRYTSYPTVPKWEGNLDTESWLKSVKITFNKTNKNEGISLYIHLPYCESLCTYCGCNKHITKNHSVEIPHINYILKEWQMYLSVLGEKPKVRELHLGGGTPTFFSPENLAYLVSSILKDCETDSESEFSFEAHPSNTTTEHLQTLFDLGFRRLSLGVQDFDPKVQEAINRKQSLEEVANVTKNARKIGYQSVNYDLIYGLPFQTPDSILDTIEKTLTLMPDRIAFYSYAHIPWLKPSQRGYDESNLPTAENKLIMYEIGKEQFTNSGYLDIGMDHFALPNDTLAIAMKNKTLHRNFMGYTALHTDLMIGLGVSSISDSWTAFNQNVKTIKEYYQKLDNEEFPLLKGHQISEEDLIIRRHILNLMCQFTTSWEDSKMYYPHIEKALLKLADMENDGLVKISEKRVDVTKSGIPFVRNICMAFDIKINENSVLTASKTI
jgi:oxygen-independent coproporphyrinogen III oxidase